MRVVIQRVKTAKVVVDQNICGEIQKGLLVLFGVHKDDTGDQTKWLVNKLINLRIFPDDEGKMNLSVKDVGGNLLVVSQFTLYANCSGGRRPDFFESAVGPQAEKIYDKFVQGVKAELGSVQTGIFGAYMDVSLVNDGPVTIILDSRAPYKS